MYECMYVNVCHVCQCMSCMSCMCAHAVQNLFSWFCNRKCVVVVFCKIVSKNARRRWKEGRRWRNQPTDLVAQKTRRNERRTMQRREREEQEQETFYKKTTTTHLRLQNHKKQILLLITIFRSQKTKHTLPQKNIWKKNIEKDVIHTYMDSSTYIHMIHPGHMHTSYTWYMNVCTFPVGQV